jgi:hypothetical protein
VDRTRNSSRHDIARPRKPFREHQQRSGSAAGNSDSALSTCALGCRPDTRARKGRTRGATAFTIWPESGSNVFTLDYFGAPAALKQQGQDPLDYAGYLSLQTAGSSPLGTLAPAAPHQPTPEATTSNEHRDQRGWPLADLQPQSVSRVCTDGDLAPLPSALLSATDATRPQPHEGLDSRGRSDGRWPLLSDNGRAEQEPGHRHRGSFAVQAVALLRGGAADFRIVGLEQHSRDSDGLLVVVQLGSRSRGPRAFALSSSLARMRQATRPARVRACAGAPMGPCEPE